MPPTESTSHHRRFERGGIMGYSKAMFRYKINKTIEQITYIAGNVRTTFANQRNYDRVWDTDIQKKAHIVPEDMWNETEWPGYKENIWGQGFDLGVERKNSADTAVNKAFYLDYQDMPEDICIELITHDWRDAQVKMIRIYNSHNQMDCDENYTVRPTIEEAAKLCENTPENVNFFFEVDTSDSYWKQYIDETSERLSNSQS